MVAVLFAGQGAGAVGLIVLPLMLLHQVQLMVCAELARRWGARRGNLGLRSAQCVLTIAQAGGWVFSPWPPGECGMQLNPHQRSLHYMTRCRSGRVAQQDNRWILGEIVRILL